MRTDDVVLGWRQPVSDDEVVDLTRSHGGNPEPGWWDRIRDHSLGWVTARSDDGLLVAFVNVAWDGADHAFLIDTKTRPTHQRYGLGTAVVKRAVEESRQPVVNGCSSTSSRSWNRSISVPADSDPRPPV